VMLTRLPGLMDELETLINSDPTQKDRLSPWVAAAVSNLSIIARARDAIDTYQPWAAGMESEYVNYSKEIEKEFPQKASMHFA